MGQRQIAGAERALEERTVIDLVAEVDEVFIEDDIKALVRVHGQEDGGGRRRLLDEL